MKPGVRIIVCLLKDATRIVRKCEAVSAMLDEAVKVPEAAARAVTRIPEMIQRDGGLYSPPGLCACEPHVGLAAFKQNHTTSAGDRACDAPHHIAAYAQSPY